MEPLENKGADEEIKTKRFQSYQENNPVATDLINEEAPDSDDEENAEAEIPLAPEIHMESSRFSSDYPNNHRLARPPRFLWTGDDLSAFPEPPILKVFALTWNMFGKDPPSHLNDLLPLHCNHHIYVISTQECLRSIGTSLFYSSKRTWEQQIKSHLGEDYILYKAGTLGATHLAIFLHESVCVLASEPVMKTIKTGVGNIISNKGAVAISFQIAGTSLLFVGCHLAAGQNSVVARNNDFRRIEREALKEENMPASEFFDVCIYLGDLNYRINGTREDVELLVDHEIFEPLRKGDQLSIEIKENTAFAGFKEKEINFPPSYRYDPGTLNFDSSKKRRIPAWTDRIIYKCKNKIMKQVSYDCISRCLVSDHIPVFGQFMLEVSMEMRSSTRNMKSKTCQIF